MGLSECIIVGLAVWQIIEIWRRGLIFELQRAKAEVWESSDNRLLWFLGSLLGCSFCLSPWVGWLCVAAWHFGDTPARIVLAGFAVARLANIGAAVFEPLATEQEELSPPNLESVFENEPGTTNRDGRDSADVRRQGAGADAHGDPRSPNDGPRDT